MLRMRVARVTAATTYVSVFQGSANITIDVGYWFHPELRLPPYCIPVGSVCRRAADDQNRRLYRHAHRDRINIVYAMTGEMLVGGAVALVEPLVNSVGYFFHERFWARRRRPGAAAAPPAAA
jgi:uncharacterized membrane protein